MNNLIGFGLVGFGVIGRTHLTAMQANLALHEGSINAKPRALCTRRPEACADLPFEKIYNSLEDLIRDSEVKVLDICTPNNLHAEAAIAGFCAGKGVYSEKPLSNEYDESEKLRTLAEQSNLPNQCALVLRFFPMVNRMKDMLEAGIIGEPIHFRISYFQNSYLNADRPMTWRQDLGQSGGGVAIDLGIHVLDLVRYLLGNVKRIRALTLTLHKTRKTKEGLELANNTDEYLKTDLEMENGACGTMECSGISKSSLGNDLFEVFGTKGTLLLCGKSFSSITVDVSGNQGISTENSQGKYESELLLLLPDSSQTMGTFMNGHAAAIKNMANWAAGLAPFSGTPTFAEAAKAQALVHACLRSAAEDGRWEAV